MGIRDGKNSEPGWKISDLGWKIFGSEINIPDPDLYFLPIPDPGVKEAPDPGSRSANTA